MNTSNEFSADMPVSLKADYVKAQKQSRAHRCHWPACERQVPPAMFMCRAHWFTLPPYLRMKIWRTYRPGQEKDWSPPAAYVQAANEVQAWIAARGAADHPAP